MLDVTESLIIGGAAAISVPSSSAGATGESTTPGTSFSTEPTWCEDTVCV